MDYVNQRYSNLEGKGGIDSHQGQRVKSLFSSSRMLLKYSHFINIKIKELIC